MFPRGARLESFAQGAFPRLEMPAYWHYSRTFPGPDVFAAKDNAPESDPVDGRSAQIQVLQGRKALQSQEGLD